MATTKKYTAASIEVLSGLDPVRKNPGMYTNTEDPLHLVQEVIDNSVDEAMMGHAKTISVVLTPDAWIEVTDDGRGMPVDMHPQEKKPGVEVILTTLHAGGKFSNKNYEFSGGLHGVGVSVVNALSEELEVEIYRDAKVWQLRFAHGTACGKLKSVRKIAQSKTGTKIRFIPDKNYFHSIEIPRESLKRMLKTKAILCPNLKINYHDQTNDEKCQWHYNQDLTAYFSQSLNKAETLFEKHWVFHEKNQEFEIECCLNWLLNPSDTPLTESYVNLIQTPREGTHVNGLRSSVIASVREFGSYQNLIPKNKPIASEDIIAGLSYVLAIKMQRPEFAGQTKERLNSRSATAMVHQAIHNALSLWFNRYSQQGKNLFELIALYAEQRQQVNVAKTPRKKALSHLNLPAKLSDCTSQNIAETELFIVEGNSAGGSAKQARDKRFQAILPLRGKIMNTWETPVSQLLDSEEISNIASAIGVKAGSDDLRQLRYGKICVLADADSDGLHIASLLVALFKKHFTHLVEKGHFYVALPPLFRVDFKKEKQYIVNQKDLDFYLKKLPQGERDKVNITRFKGLGEMNASQLKESVMNLDARRLLHLTMDDKKDELLDMLFTKSRAGDRKAWLEEKGNLATDLL